MHKKIRKNKGALYFLFAISIAALLCIQAGAINLEKTIDGKDQRMEGYEKVPFTVKKLGQTPTGATNVGNVLVSINSQEDDILPDITTDQNGDLVVTWTHEYSILDADMAFGFSSDSGSTWQANLVEIESFQRYANSALVDTTKHEGDGTFNGVMGSWVDPLAETYGAYQLLDIYDDSTWDIGVWADGGSPGIEYNKVEDDSLYLMAYYDQYSMVMASIYDGNDLDRGLVCHWLDAVAFGGSVENWDAESAQVSGPAQDPDLANVHDANSAVTQGDYFYMVWQRNNPSSGKAEVLYKEVVPIDESDIEYVSNFGNIDAGDLYDAAHPDVEATSSRAVVAYMTNNNVYGDWDIGIAYTTDRGQTWTTGGFAVNQPQVDETYPALYMSGNTVSCIYVSNGNLYLVASEDGGVTWGEPEQINDADGTVVAEENSLDISGSGIVWTDTRNGNKDIYYASAGSAPVTPARPDGPSSVRTNRQATYTTTSTDPNGDQIYYWFDWGDGSNSGWVGPYNSGADASASHKWTADGDYEVKVKAKDTSDNESPWSPSVPVSVPRGRLQTLLQELFFRFLRNLKI